MRGKAIWMPGKGKKASPKISEFTKISISRKADALVESTLKPKHIMPPPAEPKYNYPMDIFTKWHGRYLYFCARYNCPFPDAVSPSFETKFARLEYITGDLFNLAYMRHTGSWQEIAAGWTLSECFKALSEFPHFAP
jgi:hypothetical protein